MLSQKHRLPLDRTNKNPFVGKRKHTSFFTIVYSPNKLGYFRAAVIISKKIHPHAVDRNHLKRQLLQAIKYFLPPHLPLDLIVIPKASAKNISFPKLKTRLSPLLSTFVVKFK